MKKNEKLDIKLLQKRFNKLKKEVFKEEEKKGKQE